MYTVCRMTMLTLVTVYVLLNVPLIKASYKVDAHTRAREFLKSRTPNRLVRRSSEESFSEIVRLSDGESWRPRSVSKTVQGTTLEKMQEYYNDIPVFDAVVTAETDQNGGLIDMVGTFVHGIENDLNKSKELSKEECLQIAFYREGDTNTTHLIGNKHVNYVFYVDDHITRLACLVEYLTESEFSTKRPFYVIDAHTGEIIMKWDALATFSCSSERYKSYGGNSKTGKIKYGENPYCLDMRVQNGICYLENQYVRVVDMKNTRNASIQTTASFPCKNGYDDEVNGAYSPAVDALFYGTLVGKMFQDWFNTSAYGRQIVIRVHYSKYLYGAFWNGENCTFGDGSADEGYFPCTVMDMIAHEIAHGVTEVSSNLLYYGEPGGINEAFSDIIGEATEEYFRSADFVVGSDCTMGDYPIREFYNPHNDNVSLANIREMEKNTDPHHSSGIFRRAFYVIVKQKRFDLRNAVQVLLHANRMYWHHMSTFSSAACGVIKSAYDLGFSVTPFLRGFNDVGISPCNISSHIIGLANNRTYTNLTVTPITKPLFSFQAPVFSREIFILASSDTGDVQITVSKRALDDPLPVGRTVAQNYSTVTLQDYADRQLYIELSTQGTSVLNSVSLVAGYRCMDSFDRSNSQQYTAFLITCKHG